MSDDEGPDDYGDYEDIGEEPLDEGGLGPDPGDAEPEDGEGDEIGLDEDAAGTDDEDDEEEEDEGAGDDEEPAEPAGASAKAAAQRARVDPILRMSNKHRVVRVVPPEERVTDNRLHRSEAAYIIAMRAEQIAKYAKSFTHAPNLHDPVAIAFKELFDRRTPFTLRRPVGSGPAGELIVEEWNVREMTLPPLTPPVPLGATSAAGGPPRGGPPGK